MNGVSFELLSGEVHALVHITLKNIANDLGLSTATVSRALNGIGRIGDETRETILKRAHELGYVPNDIARSLKTRKTFTIGVIIPDATNTFYSTMLKSIDQLLSQRGYSILFCDSDENIEKETKYFELLKSKNVDGMIIVTSGKNDIYQREKKLTNIIFVDNIPTIDRKFSYVNINNIKAAYELTQLVIDNGHKHIAVICADLTETTGYDRLEGYRRCIIDNGLEYNAENVYQGSFRYQTGYEAAQKMIEKRLPTAIFAQNNVQAYGAIQCLRESSISIPDDISVVCFDAIDKTGMMFPKLTCVMQPVEEIGTTAVQCILDNLDGSTPSATSNILNYRIVMGDSLKNIGQFS